MSFYDYGEIEIQGISGQAALGFQKLIVHIDVRLRQRETSNRVVVVDITGQMTVGACPVGRLVSPYGALELSSQEGAVSRNTIGLELETSNQRLAAIEDHRCSGDIEFTVYLGIYLRQEQIFRQINSSPMKIKVPQSEWVKILERTGYKKILLLEIPVPNRERNPELSKAFGYLQDVQQAITRGEYRTAIGHGRDVLENLSTVLGDEDINSEPAIQQLIAGSRNWGKEKRLQAVRRALLPTCHAARHANEVAVQIDWDREDAIFTFNTLSAIFTWFDKTNKS